MKLRMIVVACALMALACVTQAATDDHDHWVGVWQAKPENLPGLTLTLADDTGDLGGTVVFDIFNHHENRLIAHEPHTLMHPHLEGNILSFQVKRCCGTSEPLNMTLELTKDGKAQLRCSDCGSNEATELERTQ